MLENGKVLQDYCIGAEMFEGTVELINNEWLADDGQLEKYEASTNEDCFV